MRHPPFLAVGSQSTLHSIDEIDDDSDANEHTLFIPILQPAKSLNQPQNQIHKKTSIEKLNNFAASIPAVFLGLILNMLDALSYGIIIFPALPATAQIKQSGVSMFLISTLVSQLVFSLNSEMKGVVGSMMIEVMPFLHIICNIITKELTNASSHSVLSTIMVAYALSTLLTGAFFLILGYFRLGNFVHYFPRHILVGCIAGIGLFLIETAVKVTSGIEIQFDSSILRLFDFKVLKVWLSSLFIAIGLKCAQTKIKQPLFVPIFYSMLPIVFYGIAICFNQSVQDLKDLGWLFDNSDSDQTPFYSYLTFFDFSNINLIALIKCIPTMIALSFFGVLHVPINVPAFSISTHQTMNLNKELMNHGWSNLAAGLLGTTQNYLVYSNSVLYYRSGGKSKMAGVLLAFLTIVVLIFGGQLMSLVPVVVVGALIFHLGIDLLKESVYDNWNASMTSLEYSTVVLIAIVMGVYGFTEGIVLGLLLACIFFVYTYSQQSILHSIDTEINCIPKYSSTASEDSYDITSHSTTIFKLQGFLFFGTANKFEQSVRSKLESSRHVILDFSMVAAIDYSIVESLQNLKTKAIQNDCIILYANVEQSILLKMIAAGVLDKETCGGTSQSNEVVVFESLNDALVWCSLESRY